jgi:hypothetical protein
VRGVASGGGRRRGREEGAAGRREDLAVEMKERDRDPDRNAIVMCIGESQRKSF